MTELEKKEKQRERSRKWYEANKDRARENTYRWRVNNKEKASRWGLENKERRAATNKIWYEKNKERALALSKAWVGTHKELLRIQHVLRTYGLEHADHIALLHKQDYKCALYKVCGRVVDLYSPVDHSKKTGEVRGILCSSHNTALGVFGDTVEGLQLAIDYLKASQ